MHTRQLSLVPKAAIYRKAATTVDYNSEDCSWRPHPTNCSYTIRLTLWQPVQSTMTAATCHLKARQQVAAVRMLLNYYYYYQLPLGVSPVRSQHMAHGHNKTQTKPADSISPKTATNTCSWFHQHCRTCNITTVLTCLI